MTAARRDLVEATRDLLQAVGTTDLGDDDLLAAAERVRGLGTMLARSTRATVPHQDYASAVGTPVYDIDPYNPAHPSLTIRYDGGTANARVTLGALYQGPENSLHGGVAALLMDDMLGSLVQQQGHLCVTGTLQLRYRSRTPLHRELLLSARVDEVAARRVHVSGEIGCGGTTTVEATGVFVRVDRR